MPYFISKQQSFGVEHTYSKSELRRLARQAPSKFVNVPESHAEQVLRRNPHYQEVPDEYFTTGAASSGQKKPPKRRSRSD